MNPLPSTIEECHQVIRVLMTIENCPFSKNCACSGEINLSEDFVRHQIYELPILKLHVTEYQLQKGCYASCRQKHIAPLSTGVTWGLTGARLTAFMSDLVAKYGLSRREQQVFLAEHFQFNISLGTVFNKQKIVNAAMEAPVAGLLPIVKASTKVYSDETSHNRDGKNNWLWRFISDKAAFFSVHAFRDKKVLHLLMSDFKNIIVSDRYVAYNIFDSSHRQICWAYLRRDFTKLSEKDDQIIFRLEKNLLQCEDNLFKIWHEHKSKNISRDELLRGSAPIRQSVGKLLEQGSYTNPKLRAARFCKNLLERFDALWTFLEVDGLDLTNNHAERGLRHFVIWRKKYFCTRSDYGAQYVARSASINLTCKLQKKSSFNFLCTLLQNHFSGISAPARLLMA